MPTRGDGRLAKGVGEQCLLATVTFLFLHKLDCTITLGISASSEVFSDQLDVPVTSLKFARRELPDEDVRRAALDRLRSLLVLDVNATRLGVSLQQIANRTSSPDMIEQSVKDCFRAKASSTLQKRAASLWRLSKMLLTVGAESQLNFTEEQLYDCLCELRARGAGATSAQHIIEALWFLDGAAKFPRNFRGLENSFSQSTIGPIRCPETTGCCDLQGLVPKCFWRPRQETSQLAKSLVFGHDVSKGRQTLWECDRQRTTVSLSTRPP